MGFEPTVPCGITGFQDQLHKPLGHPSVSGTYCIITKGPYPVNKAFLGILAAAGPLVKRAPPGKNITDATVLTNSRHGSIVLVLNKFYDESG